VILVDSNILIDIFNNDNRWMTWSRNALAESAEKGPVAVNQIVIAEVAPQFVKLQDFNDWIGTFDVAAIGFDGEAAFRAGLAFQQYRKRRRAAAEIKISIIADFLIGGHAQILDAAILTRDPRFYRIYFPNVPLITPEPEND
jgi:predicted nucleic acid-binding protein